MTDTDKGQSLGANVLLAKAKVLSESHPRYAYQAQIVSNVQYASSSALHGKTVISVHYEIDRDNRVAHAWITGGGGGLAATREIYYVGNTRFERTDRGWDEKLMSQQEAERIYGEGAVGFVDTQAMMTRQFTVLPAGQSRTQVFRTALTKAEMERVVQSAKGDVLVPDAAEVAVKLNSQSGYLDSMSVSGSASHTVGDDTLNHNAEVSVEFQVLPHHYFIVIPEEISKRAGGKRTVN